MLQHFRDLFAFLKKLTQVCYTLKFRPMIKKLFSTIAMLFLVTIIFANSVPMDVAKTVATKWYDHYKLNGVTDITIGDSFETKYNGVTTFYTFIFNSGGFVMVPADDMIHPIIGYSVEGNLSRYNIPENAQAFFDRYSVEISKNIDANSSNAETILEWNQILNEQFTKSPSAVSPLCATTWDQTTPYNNLCPAGVPTGCVATGMSQIMKKWNYPTTGVGSHTYTSAYAGPLTANFGATTYQWASMLNSYSGASTAAQKTAVATLMSHAGISVDMNYAPAGSGAYNTAVAPALINYFAYQPSAEAKNKASFSTDAAWDALIKAEMDQGRPCLLAGNDGTGAAGHEFVCDGYNIPVNHFHINWGWAGSYNGYFYLTALNPGSYNFSSGEQATIRIRPLSGIVPIANFTASNTIPAIGAPVDFTDNSLNSPTSWLWTFEGGTPATSTLQNPTGVTFATNGYHVISLTATNINGSDIKTKERYIKVGGAATVWIRQNSSFVASSRGIDEIDIVDVNTVWAKAYDGTNPSGYIREFTRTNNAGTTWTPGTITFTGSTNYGCSNIFAVDYLTAYACMFPLTGTGGAIVKTTDGGATWAIQSTAPFTNSWADFVHFFDANNGVCMGDPTATTASDFVIYTTSNGGTTWTQVSTGSLPNSLASEAGIVNLYTTFGNTVWFATNKGRMYKSTDKGLTWTVNTTGFPSSFNMKFKDANTGIAVSDTIPYDIKKTINGGTTWTTLAPTGYLVKRPIITFVPGTTSRWHNVAAFPSNGSSYSMDDCTSMMNVDTGSVQFLSVSFLDGVTGWAGSFNQSSTLDGIYKWDPSVLSATDVASAETLDQITVYPVPSRNIVNIQFGQVENENMVIEVFNMLGEKVISEQIKVTSRGTVELDLTDRDAGLYFVNIQNGSNVITKKITIVR